MVLAKISSIMHEQILNLYVFKSWLLKFQTAKNIEMENVAPTGHWFFHIVGFASLFLFYFITYKSSLFVPLSKCFILIINWINWICAGKAGGKNVKMGCLPHSNWGDFVFSLLLVDLRLLRLHVTPLPVRLRLWVHWRTVCVHGPKWKSHRGATRR